MKKSTSELFVSHRFGDTELSGIFTTTNDAEKVNDTNNDTFEKYSTQFNPSEKNKRPYKVKTLYDALEEIKDFVRESAEHSERCRLTDSEY